MKNKYSEEVIEWLKLNHKGKSTIQCSKEINEIFDMRTTPDNIQNLKSRIKKRDGFIFEKARNDGCIKKGNIPINKGKKWDDYLTKEQQEQCRKTTYKKGNIPCNHKPIGFERINVDGYIEIKVAEPNLFKLKHRVIYEQNFGEIPKDHIVIFADGNKQNLTPNNLILISKSENLILNSNKLRFNKEELTKSGVLIAKVIDKVNKVKNERL